MSFTLLPTTTGGLNFEQTSSFGSPSLDNSIKFASSRFVQEFTPRLSQNRTMLKDQSPSRLSTISSHVTELGSPLSISDLLPLPAELCGIKSIGSHNRYSCPMLPPLKFSKIGAPTTTTVPTDISSRPATKDEHAYLTPESTPSPVLRHSHASLLRSAQIPRSKSLRVPPTYSPPSPPTSFRKRMLRTSSQLRFSSSANTLATSSTSSSLSTEAHSDPYIPRPDSPTVLDLRTLSSSRLIPDSDSESVASSSNPTHQYALYQPQPRPFSLPPPSRDIHPHRRPIRIPLPPKDPTQNRTFIDREANLSHILDFLTNDLHKPTQPIQPTPLDEDQEEADSLSAEEKDLEALKQKAAKRRSMVPFIEYYDLLTSSSTNDLAVVYNIKTRQFRTEPKSSLLERCYRSTDHEFEPSGEVKTGEMRNANLQNECAPALVDGMVASIPLPSTGNKVVVSWLNVLPNAFHYREREVLLPGWVLTGRSMGKVEEVFIEKV